MWLFTRYGFFSVSYNKTICNMPGFIVRARSKAHLHALKRRFPSQLRAALIICTPRCDYGYRIVVDATVWPVIVQGLASEQTWSNFKKEAEVFAKNKDHRYIEALHTIWSTMLWYQYKGAKCPKK